MQIMGANTWDFEVDKDMLIKTALDFADTVKQQGVENCSTRGTQMTPSWCGAPGRQKMSKVSSEPLTR